MPKNIKKLLSNPGVWNLFGCTMKKAHEKFLDYFSVKVNRSTSFGFVH